MTEIDFYILLRSALIQQHKAMIEQARALKMLIAALDKKLEDLQKNKTVV
jgi:hypothetical protein